MRIPTVKGILAAFPDLSRDEAKTVRAKLERIRDFDPHAPLAPCTRWQFTYARLGEISDLLGHYGTEVLGQVGTPEVFYSNGGDTYSRTILIQSPGNKFARRCWIGSWGDWVEAQEVDSEDFE